jgi:tetratricopeptide (TPR) repeat protein
MSDRRNILSTIAACVIVAAISPQIAGAWFVNQANVAIAHATSLPLDSPQRASALIDAETDLNQARRFSDDGRVLLSQTRTLLARGDAASAARTFDQAGAELRTDPIARFVWADAAQQSGQALIAIDHWRTAGAYTYFSQQMHRATDSHQWQTAEEYARAAVGIEPHSADAHFVLGDVLSRQDENNAQALDELDRARELTRDPELLSTFLSREGEILASQGQLLQALDNFDQARAVAPIDARPRTDAAVTRLRLEPEARDQSVALLKRVVADSPWYTAAYIALASISETGGDAKGAEDWLQKGLVHNVNNPDLLFALGQFYARQHRPDEARTTFVSALKYETRADNLQTIATALTGLNGQ